VRPRAQIGGLFPGPSKTTRAYLHPEDKVRDALKAAGFEVRHKTRRACAYACA
jgi:magnesium-protoporphyrin O-methyltransferase